MNKYTLTLIFYAASFVVIYVLSVVSPGQQDGGPGLNSLAVMVLALSSLVLMIFNVVKGFKAKDYFILAAIHMVVLLGLVFTLFL